MKASLLILKIFIEYAYYELDTVLGTRSTDLKRHSPCLKKFTVQCRETNTHIDDAGENKAPWRPGGGEVLTLKLGSSMILN